MAAKVVYALHIYICGTQREQNTVHAVCILGFTQGEG